MTRLSQERYAAICEASPDAIVVVDEDGVVTYANARVTDVFGYEQDELVGESVETLVPDSKRAGHVAKRDAYVADPEARPMGADVDLTGVRKDGSELPVDISLSPLDADGSPRVMAAIRDVSDRNALRQKYQSILEAVPDAVVIAEADGGEIVEVNERATELWGYPADELVGKPQTALHPPEEAERYREMFDGHATQGSSIRSQLPDGSDVLVETRDGETVPVEINARTFELAGRHLLVGVFRDISARRRRERQLRELNAVTQDLMDASDEVAVARLVSDAASRILGYDRTVVRFVERGERFLPVFATEEAVAEMGERPNYPVGGETPVGRAYERGEPICVDDVRAFEDGYDRGDVRAGLYLPLGDHGVLSVGETTVDAFDRSDLELASLLAANTEKALDRLDYERELERQNDRLENFTRVVSHDLRNPLTVAQGWLDMIHTDDDGAIEKVSDALERMSAIIEDTLVLAREGRTVGAKTDVAVGSLAEECWQTVSTADAVLDVADAFTVRADATRLRHVFENLFRNAVEHGGSDVTVTVGRSDRDGFYVEDDGTGIPPGEREAVFEPGRSSAWNGTGFGLTIVKEIAEAHGWRVDLTESDAGGARFEFSNVDLWDAAE